MTSALFRSDASRSTLERAYQRYLDDTPQARSHRVATRFGETHMLVAGQEHAPPLLMLHGALSNSAMAIREAHPLLDQFRVYALDVLGQSLKSADVRLRWDGVRPFELVARRPRRPPPSEGPRPRRFVRWIHRAHARRARARTHRSPRPHGTGRDRQRVRCFME